MRHDQPATPDKQTVIVLGGGIVGAFTAYFLARFGAAPILVERDGIGVHASGINPGGLNPLHGPGIPGPMEAVAMTAFTLHLENHDEIRRLSGTDSPLARAPRIHIAMDDADAGVLEATHAIHSAREGFSARWLTREELRAMEPRLSENVQRGLWADGNAHVDAARYTRAVADAAVALGGRIVNGTASGVDIEGCKVTGVRVDGSSLACDAMVIATGPWTDEPAGWLGLRIPIVPVKGELLHVRTAAPVLHDFAWREAAIYGGPGHDTVLGGTMERAGFDAMPTAHGREKILAGIRAFFPGLNDAEVVRHTAALRPVTPDGLPIVGSVRDWDNVCVALGGGRKGMLFATVMGRAAAEFTVNGRTTMPVDSWLPDRFSPDRFNSVSK